MLSYRYKDREIESRITQVVKPTGFHLIPSTWYLFLKNADPNANGFQDQYHTLDTKPNSLLIVIVSYCLSFIYMEEYYHSNHLVSRWIMISLGDNSLSTLQYLQQQVNHTCHVYNVFMRIIMLSTKQDYHNHNMHSYSFHIVLDLCNDQRVPHGRYRVYFIFMRPYTIPFHNLQCIMNFK